MSNEVDLRKQRKVEDVNSDSAISLLEDILEALGNIEIDADTINLNTDELEELIESGTTGTSSSVAASVTSVTLMAANSLRKGGAIFNDSTVNLYIKFGLSASTSSFTIKVPANWGFSLSKNEYNGIITGVWDSATGNARITEIT